MLYILTLNQHFISCSSLLSLSEEIMTIAGMTELNNNTSGLKSASSDFKSLVMKRIKDDPIYNCFLASLTNSDDTSDTKILKRNKRDVRTTKAKTAVTKRNTRTKHFVRPLNSQVKDDQAYNIFTSFLNKVNRSMDKKTLNINKSRAHSKAKKVALRSVSSKLPSKVKVKKEQKQAVEYLLSANPSWPFNNAVLSLNANNILPFFQIDRKILCKQKQNSRCKKCANDFYNKYVIQNQHKTVDITTIHNSEEGCVYGGSPLYFVLHYFHDGTQEALVVVPVIQKGTFAGKYIGHPRFKAVILDTNVNWSVVLAHDYHAITVVTVAKTTRVANEAWIIPTKIEKINERRTDIQAKTEEEITNSIDDEPLLIKFMNEEEKVRPEDEPLNDIEIDFNIEPFAISFEDPNDNEYESPLTAFVENEIDSDDEPLLTRYGKRCSYQSDDDGGISLGVLHHKASGRPSKLSKSLTTITASRRSTRTSKAPTNADGTIAQSYSASTAVAARCKSGLTSTHAPTVTRTSSRSAKVPVNSGTIARSYAASSAVAARRSSDSTSTPAPAVTRTSSRSTRASTTVAASRSSGSNSTPTPAVTRFSRRSTKSPLNADGTKVQSYS
jgi:hypothetical protein